MRCSPERGKSADERGFTLVEVLAAGTILSIVILGVVRLWGVVDRFSVDLLFRQKAVFVLNGEIARLSSLFAVTNFGTTNLAQTTGYAALPNVPSSATRTIYPTDATTPSFVVTSPSTFAGSDTLVYQSGTGSTARDYVWLDRDRSLAARLSWTQSTVTTCGAGGVGAATGTVSAGSFPPVPAGASACNCYPFSGPATANPSTLPGVCYVLTLVLEFPFAFDPSSGSLTQQYNPQTVTLATIVGRRV